MIKMVFMLKRHPELSRDAFIDYYESHHARLGERHAGNAARYVRRYLTAVPGPFSDADAEFDVITELWFDNQAEMDRTMAHLAESDVHAEIAADEAVLFDRARSRVYVVHECESAPG